MAAFKSLYRRLRVGGCQRPEEPERLLSIRWAVRTRLEQLLVRLAAPNHKRSLSFRGRLTATDPVQTLVLRWPGSAVDRVADTRRGFELQILLLPKKHAG